MTPGAPAHACVSAQSGWDPLANMVAQVQKGVSVNTVTQSTDTHPFAQVIPNVVCGDLDVRMRWHMRREPGVVQQLKCVETSVGQDRTCHTT